MSRPKNPTAGVLVVLLFGVASVTPAGTPPAKEGEMCGTIRAIPCAEGLWCDLRAGACQERELEGVCVKPADACTEDYAPVCGCSGKTHSNDCKRIQAREQKNHVGECGAPPS